MPREDPLLLRACLNGAFGHVHAYDGGFIAEAGFIYLSGNANIERLRLLFEPWRGRMFICLSETWKEALLAEFPQMHAEIRRQMEFASFDERALTNLVRALPDAYELCPFGAREFAARPFGHGQNYADFADFAQRGVGAAVWREGEIVSSASSFITYENSAEADISTNPAHRRKGLAAACAAQTLLACAPRDLCLHWDAQNEASKRLAEKLGYRVSYEYPAYTLVDAKRFLV